ncbi:MAG: rRNA maturation RNase YbeY [Thermomicrobiales bacterium]
MSDTGAHSFELVEVTVESATSLPKSVTGEAVASLVEHVLRLECATGRWNVAFQFTADDEMQRMHREFMGLDSPTDILTFPYDADDWGEAGTPVGSEEKGGDIVISVDRAREQADEGEWDVANELFFLVCHGMLHLLGWDDASDKDRAEMLDRQRELLSEWTKSASASPSG